LKSLKRRQWVTTPVALAASSGASRGDERRATSLDFISRIGVLLNKIDLVSIFKYKWRTVIIQERRERKDPL
jgi:hypothetical protein